jgi:hypothetical protein
MAFTKKIDGGLGEGVTVSPGVRISTDTPRSVQDILRNEPKVEIMIHKQEGPEGKADVFVSIEGYALLIKRGFWVAIPESFVKNLDTCNYTILTQEEDGQGGTIETRSEVARFSYTTRPVQKKDEEQAA